MTSMGNDTSFHVAHRLAPATLPDRPQPHQPINRLADLLGVAPSEQDPVRVIAAARDQLRRLRLRLAGSPRGRRPSLRETTEILEEILRISEARDALLAVAAKRLGG